MNAVRPRTNISRPHHPGTWFVDAIVEAMKAQGVTMDRVAYHIVMGVHMRLGSHEGVVRSYLKMSLPMIGPTGERLLVRVTPMGILEGVDEVGIEMDEVAYGAIVTACQRVKDAEGVWKVVGRMREIGGVSARVYGGVIGAMRTKEEAGRVLREMLEEGVKPDEGCLNALAELGIGLGDVRMVMRDEGRIGTPYEMMQNGRPE
ncbi:hypothetical protein BC829DRAFT_439888 [Chytridium lagenaria]|nr:hypothetical protein BC829DRAFT_439888 [Chytridium lagenaria]